MRKIYLLITLLIFTNVHIFSQYTRPSVLQIVAPSTQLIQVSIDNSDDYNEWASNQVFNNIYPGRYFVKIVKNNILGLSTVVYSSYLQIQEGMRCKIMVDNFGKCKVQYIPLNTSTVFQIPYPNNENNYPSPYPNYPNYPREYNRRVMNESEFQTLLQSINDESFDDDKFKVLQSVINTQMFNISQVIQLVQAIDSKKLACAKLMYGVTIPKDRALYYKVANELTFKSEKDELYKYITEQQAAQKNDRDPSPYPNYPNYPREYNRRVMNESEFQTLLQSINDESFDDDKLNMLKPFINSQTFELKQAIQIVKQFPFKKLEAAKLMYTATISSEKISYYQVANELEFASEKDDLYKYIEQQQSAISTNNIPSWNYPSAKDRSIMSDKELEKLISKVRGLAFEQDRLKLVKSVIVKHTFETQQIAKIIELGFKSKELECAKLMYDATVDQLNYTQLIKTLLYSDNKDKLYDFIKEKQSDKSKNMNH